MSDPEPSKKQGRKRPLEVQIKTVRRSQNILHRSEVGNTVLTQYSEWGDSESQFQKIDATRFARLWAGTYNSWVDLISLKSYYCVLHCVQHQNLCEKSHLFTEVCSEWNISAELCVVPIYQGASNYKDKPDTVLLATGITARFFWPTPNITRWRWRKGRVWDLKPFPDSS